MSLKLSDLKSALESKAKLSKTVETQNARIADLESQLQTAQSEAAAEKARADGLQAEIDEANKSIEGLTQEKKTLETEAKTVSQNTVEKLHEMGVPAGELPSTKGEGEDGKDLWQQYQSLKGKEKTEFFRKNFGALQRYAESQASQN